MTKGTLLAVAALPLLLLRPAGAQLRVTPVAEQGGKVEVALLLRKLQAGPTFMMTTAHPDDENNALLAQLDWGRGLRTTLVTATRGQGGQNEIGSELFDALAVLRTEELLSAHRFDGAEQFFTRAIDFGYSFSIEETLEKWGKDAILGDFVRHIRTIRPDVVAGFVWAGEGGGQHHQTSARLTAEAFRAAPDPSRYPEQIEEGLRPWQAKKFYYTAGFGRGRDIPPDALIVDSSEYDALLGRTYTEIGSEARSMHKCQGMSQLLALPGSEGRAYKLHDTVLARPKGQEPSMFDGVPTGIVEYLMQFAPGNTALQQRLEAMLQHVRRASTALSSSGRDGSVDPLSQGLSSLRTLRNELATIVPDASARFEIDFRLAQKEDIFQEALATAAGLRLEALSDDGLVVSGQAVTGNIVVANRGSTKIDLTSVSLAGLESTTPCTAQESAGGSVAQCQIDARVPASAEVSGIYFRRLPEAARYAFEKDVPFGVPFAPTPYRATFGMRIAGAEVRLTKPVQHRYQTDVLAGEKRTELLVVPALALRVSPEVLIVPTGSGSTNGPSATDTGREVRVTVINHRKAAAEGQLRLALPQGWSSEPASTRVSFTREDEAAAVRFSVRPPAGLSAGRYEVKAVLESGGRTFDRGYQVVEYPHTHRRHVYNPARAIATAVDVTVPQGLTVGYVMGVGDDVPQALAQLGLKVEFIDSDALAWGDLSTYDVIITGVRAYERRADLRANNQRLIDYARQGGVVLVNYNKFEFNEAQYGPFPARVGRERVTDQTAPVKVLAPDHPIFTTPNRIGPDAWENWVQERGLYFLDTEGRAPEYRDLIEMEDPFPFNPGVKRGALVEAQVGKGHWVYLGLGLWRQLPAGTPGAYKLMANLIALGAR